MIDTKHHSTNMLPSYVPNFMILAPISHHIPLAIVLLLHCGCAHRDVSLSGNVSVVYNRADEFKIVVRSELDGGSLPCIASVPVKALGGQEGSGGMVVDIFKAQHAGRIQIRPRRRHLECLKYCDNPLGAEVIEYDGKSAVVFVNIPKYRNAVLSIELSQEYIEALDFGNKERVGFPIALITIPGKPCTEYCAYFAMEMGDGSVRPQIETLLIVGSSLYTLGISPTNYGVLDMNSK